jgi:F-type H+-transporting ATPase subunit delta
MPTPERWAAQWTARWSLAFVRALGQDPETVGQGLTLLKRIYPVIDSIHASGGRGEPSGTAAAGQLEGMLRAALKEAGAAPSAGEAKTAEITFRFLLLLVKRGFFGHAGRIIERIGVELDALRGFLRAGLESPFPPEEDFKKDLEERLAGKTGSKGVVFEVKITPELLGGYRLRIGGEVIDASLRAFLTKMEADLAAFPGKTGGLPALPSHGGL